MPSTDRLSLATKGFFGNLDKGPIAALIGGIGSGITGMPSDPGTIAQGQRYQKQLALIKGLQAHGVSNADITASLANPEYAKKIMDNAVVDDKPAPGFTKDDNGQHFIPGGSADPAYLLKKAQAEAGTPASVQEYKYYVQNLPKGTVPMDYATFSTAKARAGATNISNNVDMNSGQTYDKELAGGLAKAHAGLANGVEEAQSRARDVAAMQGALDAIQKNGGSTGGMGQQQVLELKKTINAGATAMGIDNPFSEGDISDKEFLTKFNRQMAGNMAKNNVGGRVTNFEMQNYLKANPGLDMSLTGNQRLLGIQSQIEQRNIAVGNAIRDATAGAISTGAKINPVSVQKIITDYDQQHHITDPVSGQDLTQSYALPEFQGSPTNASMAKAHSENLKAMEKTVGGTTYVQRDGKWYPK